MRREPASLSLKASGSWNERKNATHLRHRLTVFQTVSEDAQRQCLNAVNCLLPRLAIREHAGKLGNFRQPAAIVFLLDFNGQRHGDMLHGMQKMAAPCFT